MPPLQERDGSGGAVNRKFFLTELGQIINLDLLLQEAYILIKGVGMTYSDVKSLTKTERLIFINLLNKEVDQQNRANK